MTITEIKAAYQAGTLPRNLDALMAIQDKVDGAAKRNEEDPREMIRISIEVDKLIDDLI